MRTFIEDNFESANVIEANSGITALSILLKKSPDLILLDIQMPQMDGFETAKIIQSRVKTQHIPIVFLTAAFKSDDFRKKGYKVGATDYLIKPIESQELTNKIQLYLRFVQKQRQQPPVIEQPICTTISGDQKSSGPNLIEDMRTSIKDILSYCDMLSQKSANLGYQECFSDIKKISAEGEHLIESLGHLRVQ